jgi:hypothetical protein
MNLHKLITSASVRAILAPVLLLLGLTIPVAPKRSESMRTYYVTTDNRVVSRKPETILQTVRATSVTHARKMLAV